MKHSLLLVALCVGLSGCNLGDPVDPIVGSNNDGNNENNETNNVSNNGTNNVSNNVSNNDTNNVSNNSTNATNNDTNNVPGFGVDETVPTAGAGDVDVFAPIRLTFSSTVDSATLTAAEVAVTDADGTEIPVQVEVDGATATLSHQGLTPASMHTVIVEATVADTDGAALEAQYAWTFTTQAALDFVSIAPMNGAAGVGVFEPLVITMSAEIDQATVSDSTVQVQSTQPVEGVAGTIEMVTVTASGSALTIEPPARGWQEYGTEYTVRIVETFRGTDGAPSGDVGAATFNTVFFSPNHTYRIFNEQTDRARGVAPVPGENLLSMANPPNQPEATTWLFDSVTGNPGYFSAHNLLAGPDLFIEVSDGNNPALLTGPVGVGQFFTGQQLRPVYFSQREAGEVQGPGESPGGYYLEAFSFPGGGRVLTTYLDVNNLVRLRMEAKGTEPRQVWWFRRVGDR